MNAFNKGLHVDFPLLDPGFSFEHLLNSSIFIQFVPRELNENADSLAKKGLGRPIMSAHWTGAV